MGDNLVPNGLGFLLEVEVSEIIVHEVDKPNAVVDLLDAEFLAGQHGGDVDPLSVQAKASTGGDENVAVMERTARAVPDKGGLRRGRVRRGISCRVLHADVHY